MYFLWKSRAIGALKISELGIRSFIQEILVREFMGKTTCGAIVFDGENGIVSIDTENERAERVVSSSMNKIGLPVKVIYALNPAPDVAIAEKIKMSLLSPWSWSALLTFIALLAFVGASGVFWLSFWGSVGWFTAKAVPLALAWLFPSRRNAIEANK